MIPRIHHRYTFFPKYSQAIYRHIWGQYWGNTGAIQGQYRGICWGNHRGKGGAILVVTIGYPLLYAPTLPRILFSKSGSNYDLKQLFPIDIVFKKEEAMRYEAPKYPEQLIISKHIKLNFCFSLLPQKEKQNKRSHQALLLGPIIL